MITYSLFSNNCPVNPLGMGQKERTADHHEQQCGKQIMSVCVYLLVDSWQILLFHFK